MSHQGRDYDCTVFERVDILCNQWVKNAGENSLPDDARHLIKKLAKQIVMEAADCCERRGAVLDKNFGLRQEAVKCAALIRHSLLCREGEHVCYSCDGAGCGSCRHTGIKGEPT